MLHLSIYQQEPMNIYKFLFYWSHFSDNVGPPPWWREHYRPRLRVQATQQTIRKRQLRPFHKHRKRSMLCCGIQSLFRNENHDKIQEIRKDTKLSWQMKQHRSSWIFLNKINKRNDKNTSKKFIFQIRKFSIWILPYHHEWFYVCLLYFPRLLQGCLPSPTEWY